MTSTLFRNGSIIDGTGKPAFAGSLLVEDDRIKDVIKNGAGLPQADKVLDAEGLVIAPGFIDMHSHADWVLPWQDHPQVLKCLVEQGITTVVVELRDFPGPDDGCRGGPDRDPGDHGQSRAL